MLFQQIENINKTFVNVQTVLQQSPGIRAVIARARGRGEEIRSVREKIQELVSSLTGDLFIEDLQKTFLIGHIWRYPFGSIKSTILFYHEKSKM